MTINADAWAKFVIGLGKLDAAATKQMEEFINRTGWQWGDGTDVLIEFAYGISTKYGEGAAALACEMYDAVAMASGASVEAAIPAQTATYSEVAKAINGTAKLGNIGTMASSVGRMVKMTGVDTTMQNAIRDGAEWAWIPHGDTCAFCITLASRGWQRASRAALKNGHAEHIHGNCDCTYAVRFNSDTNVGGYDPDKYKRMYYDADGHSPKDKINSLRREFYEENKEEINRQKRDAYEKRKELNSSKAEEADV